MIQGKSYILWDGLCHKNKNSGGGLGIKSFALILVLAYHCWENGCGDFIEKKTILEKG